jgi:hypothetical protein
MVGRGTYYVKESKSLMCRNELSASHFNVYVCSTFRQYVEYAAEVALLNK